MYTCLYVNPDLKNDPRYEEFNRYLGFKLDWPADDFPSYAWNAPIPPVEEWEEVVREMNAHLATLS
jgi:hypothetical protein